MFSFSSIMVILFVHWIADFVCQSKWMAENKSKNAMALVTHTLVYTAIWFMWLTLPDYHLIPTGQMLTFLWLTWGIHTITDAFTSVVNAELWQQQKTRAFFNVIGFDQLLHYFQLFLCWKLYILPHLKVGLILH